MKIDESVINCNAVKLIDRIASGFIDLEKDGSNLNESELAMINIGCIKGVCDMASAMKEVLKAN